MVGRRCVGPRPARRAAVRASGAERPFGRWVHPRRPRVGAREGPPRRGARAAAVGPRRGLPQRHARSGHAGLRARRGPGHARRPRRSPRRRRPVAPDRAAPGVGRRPHRLRRRAPRPAAGRLARRRPDPRGTARLGTRAGGGARRRAGVLRRRPARLRRGPAPKRGDLAAARGDRPAPRVRLARGGRRPARGRRGGGARRPRRDLRGRVVHADERVRAQPRHAAGTGARRRLLAAHDEPLPRGAGRARRPGGGRPGCGPRDGRDGGEGGVLLRPDGAARPARARPVRVHDPALGRDRRGDRRGACRLGGADPHARPARDRRHPDRPIRDPPGGGRGAHGRAVGGARPRGDAPPGRRADPDARAAAPARRPVPPRPLQRPGRGDPAGRCPVPGLVRPPAPGVRRRRVRAARARDPHERPGDEPRQPRRAVRLLATARGG